ncbi:phosphatidate cytidylyltransferase [Leucobacter sp. UCMA 4100]|uniref:phosphatidate cytidylyltransferase n=1 Tax=Leucobacter sp. UCMA 4100 TaxID=2810534 RepID=UPI0022EAF681|nr:phosphatidate cytidylyltransferase [Leucobacter sp. UCMA 4100]MDA3145998.1 phosphatidate cytidylyltransferase [Leucobacter sp. UCMA 4100]
MSEELRDDLRHRLEERKTQFDEASARIEEKAGRNLFFAIGSGLVFGAVFLLSLFLAKPVFAGVVALLVIVALIELATAYRGAGRRVPRIGVSISGLFILFGAYQYGAKGMLGGFVAGLVVLGIWRLVEGLVPQWEVPPKTLVRDVFSGLFTLAYVALLASIAILIVHGESGEWWVFTLVAVVVSVDVGAYAAGVTLGKHKMTPRISPNKTWEGFAGAVVAGVTVAIVCAVFLLELPWWLGALLGMMLVITATVGDLTESLIKRNLGVKDMSSWVPGHGGFLDRLDSLLPSTVPVYFIMVITGSV